MSAVKNVVFRQRISLSSLVLYTRKRAFSSSSATAEEKVASTTTNFDLPQIRNEITDRWVQAEASSSNGTKTRARYCCFTHHDAVREYQKPSASWHWLDRELSSNMAGETGAVYIYKGALTALNIRRDTTKEALEFCNTHMTTESSHLQYFQSILPYGKYTKLLPIWKCAGWTLGFLPTMMGGSRALYVTVEAVETFVEEHYQEQIGPLHNEGSAPELTRLLEHCCEDEVEHKEDAAQKLLSSDSDSHIKDLWWVNLWSSTVRQGSIVAAKVARRF